MIKIISYFDHSTESNSNTSIFFGGVLVDEALKVVFIYVEAKVELFKGQVW